MRRLVMAGFVAGLMLTGFSFANKAVAQSTPSTDAHMTELGIDNKAGDIIKGFATVYTAKKFVWDFGIKSVMNCEDRRAGKPGVWMGEGPAPAGQEKLQCNVATVASKAELQQDRFAMFGIDPTKAQYASVPVDLGKQRRDELSQQYAQAIGLSESIYLAGNMVAALSGAR